MLARTPLNLISKPNEYPSSKFERIRSCAQVLEFYTTQREKHHTLTASLDLVALALRGVELQHLRARANPLEL